MSETNLGVEPIDDQNQNWESGTRISIETLVEKHSIDDRQLIVDLIYNEVLLRENHGESPELSDYDLRFPELANEISRQFQFHRAFHSPSFETDRGGVTPVDGNHRRQLKTPDVPGFELLEILGRGGSAVCWRALDKGLDREVAIKLLARTFAGDKKGSLVKEAKASASLRHESIVEVYQVGESDGFPFLVMELCNGGTLADRLNKGPLLPRDVADFGFKVSQAVAHAHQQGIIHRDLKPGNILLDEDGQPNVADFGLAKRLNPELTRQTTKVVGTPAYMSPEQARGETVDEKADIYSLGATLYEMLTGRPPFQTASVWDTLYQVMQNDAIPVRQLNDRVPQDLETIVAKCLEKNPQRRYSSASELADELKRFLDDQPIKARPLSRAEYLRRWCSKNRALAGSLAAVGLLMTALVAGSVTAAFYFQSQNQKLDTAIRNSIDAADELLLSVTEDAQLLPKSPGSQQISRRLLKKAQGYYVSFLQENEGNPDLAFQLARTHAGLARVAAAFEEAENLATESEAALTLLDAVEANEETFEALLLRGKVNHTWGGALHKELKSKEAVEPFENALASFQKATELHPEETEANLQLNKTKTDLSMIKRSLGDIEEAKSLLIEGRAGLSQIIEQDPDNSNAIVSAAIAESNLAFFYIGKDLPLMQTHLANSLELVELLPEEDQQIPRVKKIRSRSYINIGRVLSMLGKVEESSGAFEKGIAEARQLVELEPSINSHKRGYLVAVLNSGKFDLQTGNYQRMVDRIRAVMPAANQLIKDSPDNMGNVELKGMLLGNLSVGLKHLEQFEEALSAAEESVEAAIEIVAGTGGTAESQETLSLSLYQHGQLLIETKQIDKAIEAVKKSRTAAVAGLESDPEYSGLAVQLIDLHVLEIEALNAKDPKPNEAILAIANRGVEEATELRKTEQDIYLEIAYGSLMLTLADQNLVNGDSEKSLEIASNVISEFHSDGDPEVEELKNNLIDAYCLRAKILSDRAGTPSAEGDDADSIRENLDAARKLGATEDEIASISAE